MKRKFWLLLFLCLFSIRSSAIVDGSLYLGMGTMSHALFELSQDNTSAPGILGTFYFPTVIQSSVRLGSELHLAPSVSYTIFGTYLLPKISSDGGSKTSYLILSLPLVFSTADSGSGFDWELGPSLSFYSIQGSGGTTVLANGAGQFALPGNTQNATTVGLLLGGSYNFQDFKVELDTLTDGLLTSRRTFSLILTLTYNLIGGSRF